MAKPDKPEAAAPAADLVLLAPDGDRPRGAIVRRDAATANSLIEAGAARLAQPLDLLIAGLPASDTPDRSA